MDINDIISSLVIYGLDNEFFEETDKTYIINELLFLFKHQDFKEGKIEYNINIVMDCALQYAKDHDLIDIDSINISDCFDAKIMDIIMPRPSEVIKKFNMLKDKSSQLATTWYYDFSILSRYIRVDRLKNNIGFHERGANTPLDITINLSKPEKDPKEIAKLKEIKSSSYPLCALCAENEGYYGSLNQAGRSNHRIIPLKLNGEDWYLQYSPYGYYNEHCIVLKKEHQPMSINENTFKRLLDFIKQFPHYFIGSNADFPIVGGSILSHEHFQGGRYVFEEAKAIVKYPFVIEDYEDVECGLVDWPLTIIRLRSENTSSLVSCANHILEKWRNYSDEENDIVANDGTPHNTITPIARFVDNKFELDLALRNNRCNDQYPDGIFHPHKELHHIKKENIGLIEVMGLAILPGRLKNELAKVKEVLLGKTTTIDSDIQKHEQWINEMKSKYTFTKDNIDKIVDKELTIVFEKCLIDCGVFKANENGFNGFKKFIETL